MTLSYEYFATCGGQPGVDANLHYLRTSDSELTVQSRVHRDYNAGGTHVSYFVPATESILPIARFLVRPKVIRSVIRNATVAKANVRALDGERRLHSDSLPFTGRVAIYSDSEIGDADWSSLAKAAGSAGIYLTFHGPEYARLRAKGEHPLAFISHDSRDKESLARRLAEQLRGFGAPVRFDEFSISSGKSLHESIERGMRECQRAIVILSRSYLDSTRSTKEEIDSLFSRNVEGKGAVVIPIWYGIDRADVGSYSAMLADYRAFQWDPHVDRLAALIFHELTGLHAPLRLLG